MKRSSVGPEDAGMLDYDTEREKRGEQVTATSFARFHASHGEKDTAQALLLRINREP